MECGACTEDQRDTPAVRTTLLRMVEHDNDLAVKVRPYLISRSPLPLDADWISSVHEMRSMHHSSVHLTSDAERRSQLQHYAKNSLRSVSIVRAFSQQFTD